MALLVTRAARGSEVSLRSGKQKALKPTWVNISAVLPKSIRPKSTQGCYSLFFQLEYF